MNAGFIRLSFACCAVCAGLIAGPPTRTALTVVMDFEAPHSVASFASLDNNLNALLSPAGITVELQTRDSLPPNPQFKQLVVFKMKGSCSMTPVPIGALSDERGPLAMAFSSDGQVLHFGEVQCDRLRHSLERVLTPGGSPRNQRTFGSALAVVMAHELYHMLANEKEHTHKGISKPSLSADELVASRLALPADALLAIQEDLQVNVGGGKALTSDELSKKKRRGDW